MSAAMPASAAAPGTHPVTILICALGGEGGGVLSEWLVDAAAHAGYAAQSTSIPGVAQRTGATTYYVEIFRRPIAALDGRWPVFSLYPVPGVLDLLVSSELLETVRQIGNGMASADRTRIITSSSRTLTTNERMQLGDGRVAAERLLEVVHQSSADAQVFDMSAMTRDAGTVVSAVMFGAIAASGSLPFSREACEAAIRAGGRGTDASLRGFAMAYESCRSHATDRRPSEGAKPAALSRASGIGGSQPHLAAAAARTTAASDPTSTLLPPEIASLFPAKAHPIVALGFARVREYQDPDYGQLYIERLQRVLAAEQAADSGDACDLAITRETARYLALWMAFDDIVRVAELKSRATRAARVRGEVKVRDGELVRVCLGVSPGRSRAGIADGRRAGGRRSAGRSSSARTRCPACSCCASSEASKACGVVARATRSSRR
jgi:indolepyruvate ferredoxin oxidoreductase beta subunit